MRRGLVAVLALTVTGCAGPATPASPDGSTAGGAGSPLEFTATTLDGRRFDGSSLAGEPVALWFGVVTQPAFVFVDRSGAVRTVQGGLGADELRRAMAELAAS